MRLTNFLTSLGRTSYFAGTALLLFSASTTKSVDVISGSIIKTFSAASACPGDLVVFSLAVTNTGVAPIETINLTDTAPNGLTFESVLGTGGSWDVSLSNNTITATYTGLPVLPNESTASFSVSARVSSNPPNPITNSASATISGAGVSGTALGSANLTIGSATLSITKEVDKATACPGDTLLYTITVTNNGTCPANNILVSDPLPSEVTFANVVSTDGWSITNNGTVIATRDNIPASESRTFSFNVTVNSTVSNTIISNTATVQSGNAGDAASIAANTSIDVPLLNINKTVDKTIACPGNELLYTIEVTNSGPCPAINPVVIDNLPSQQVTFVSTETTNGWTVNHTNGQVVAQRTTLSGSSSFSFRVQIKPTTPANTQIQDSASVSAEGVSQVQSNTVTTTVNTFGLTAQKQNFPSTVNAGDQFTYTIDVTNTSSACTISGITLTDQLTNATFISASGTGWTIAFNAGNTSFTATRNTLAPNTTAPITVTVQAPNNATSISNTLTTSSTNPQLGPTSSTTTATVINPLTVTKSGPKSVVGGDLITYIITITNNSLKPIQGISFTDPLQDELKFRSAQQTGGAVKWSLSLPPKNTTGTISGSTKSFPAGDTATFQIVVKSRGVGVAEQVSNTVTVTSKSPVLNRTATVTTQILPATTTQALANANIKMRTAKNALILVAQGGKNKGRQIVRVITNGQGQFARTVHVKRLPNGTVDRKVHRF